MGISFPKVVDIIKQEGIKKQERAKAEALQKAHDNRAQLDYPDRDFSARGSILGGSVGGERDTLLGN